MAAGTIRAPPKKSFVRRLITYTIVGGVILYPTAAWISTQNEGARDLFVQLPGGEWLADYADDNNWEQFGVGTITQQVAKLTSLGKGDVQAKVAEARDAAERKAHELSSKARAAADDVQTKLRGGSADASSQAHAAADSAKDKAAELRARTEAAALKARDSANKTADKLADEGARGIKTAQDIARNTATALVGTAAAVKEDAKTIARIAQDKTNEVASKANKAASDLVDSATPVETNRYPDTQRPRPLRPETVTPAGPTHEGEEKWSEKLPIGYEPPPGYYVPAAPKAKVPEAGEKLPLLAPKVKDFGSEEPIISQLASTIDSLTSSLSSAKGGPSTEAANILNKATSDLSSLNARLGEVKKTEQERLQKTVEAKTREFEQQLAVKEKEWQKDEQGLKETWEAERQKMVDGWRDVLNGELETQRQTIEQRLKEEVVSQGIELQRRWLRSIKAQVETERGGRLAKLDALTTSLKQLERITLDNSAVLDDNVRLHKIWSALRAVQSKAERGDQAFDDELRVLQALSTPSDPDTAGAEDTVMRAALAQLEASGIPQTGVKSFTVLSNWFTNRVAPRIHETSLVPAPEEATVATHLVSTVLSKILFRPQAGLVPGDDVGAVLARAEWALNEKDLDAAAREVNNLRGWPRKLAEDWLREARRKLEVQQALDIVGTEATLSSLLLV